MAQRQEFFGEYKMSAKSILQSITTILVLGIIGFSFGYLLLGSTSESIETSSSNQNIQNTNAEDVVQEIDGVQTVTLSWGKFSYNPNIITVTAGKPVKIIADLTRLQGCFRSFIIRDLGINTYFSANNNAVEFTPTEKGTYRFTCAMGMGKGTLIVQ